MLGVFFSMKRNAISLLPFINAFCLQKNKHVGYKRTCWVLVVVLKYSKCPYDFDLDKIEFLEQSPVAISNLHKTF